MEYLISENALISEETLLRFDWQGIKFKKKYAKCMKSFREKLLKIVNH